ncbi:ABC transporter substrate-binding protein [Pseudactinotalea sp.]|uniref:ABC transporter substrate-binding protein n=1 Tax=Pseudactinotalea sp. TaxID=1926260 RepID=UPI003B3A2C48
MSTKPPRLATTSFAAPRTSLTRRSLLQYSMAGGAAAMLGACSGQGAQGKTTITVANVSNPVTEDLQELTRSEFNAIHPDIEVRFSSLPETELRERVARDVANGSGQFDVLALGPYETSQYSSQGWLADLRPLMDETEGYDAADLIPSVMETLSSDDQIWGAPVYAESAFLMYRTDVFEERGLTMPEQPTWQEVAELAHTIHGPDLSGIALRGLPGENQVSVMSVIYAFGGRLFTPEWEPTFTEAETREAINFYVDLVRSASPVGAASAGYNQALSSFAQGQAAMFMDATVAANTLEDPDQSTVAGKVGYAPAPHYRSDFGGWYWSWALSIPESSRHQEAAWSFVSWATSQDYIKLAGETFGWERVPPGTRLSTYEISEYQEAAPFAAATLEEIAKVSTDKLLKPTAPPQLPAAYFEFPQWTDVYMPMSQEIAAAIAGQQTADQAVDAIQASAEATMSRIGLWAG